MTIDLTRRAAMAGAAAAILIPPAMGMGTRPVRAQGAARAMGLAYPRQIGGIELTAISDGFFEIPADQMLINIAPEELEAALSAAFIDPAGPLRGGVTAFLLREGERTVLVDTGAADLFGPTVGQMPATLAALGVAPESVDTVLLTHMHPDHIGGLLAEGAPAYPNATVHVNEVDLDFWTDEAIASQAPAEAKGMFDRARATAAAYGERLLPFAGETEVIPGATSLPLPGHTPGHTGYRIVSEGAEILLFGDVANVAPVQFPHPEAGTIFDIDPALAVETRGWFFDMLATDRTLVAGAHMGFPAIGHVARAGNAYAWVPEPWHYG